LIPFRNRKRNCVECQLIVDYKGLVDLVKRSGQVSFIHADVICENDEFAYDRGEVVRHKIDLRQPRGNPYGVYCRIRFKDGSEQFDVMSRDDVERIRARSKAAEDGPWKTDWNEMAKKTVFRRISKWLPLSAEVRDANEADNEAFEEHRFENARPIFDAKAIGMRPESFLPIREENQEQASTPQPPPPAEPPPGSPQQELESIVLGAGCSYDDLRRCGEANQWPVDFGSFGSFAELPVNNLSFLLKNKSGLILALKTFKEGK
jgi:recombination protein RecT